MVVNTGAGFLEEDEDLFGDEELFGEEEDLFGESAA